MFTIGRAESIYVVPRDHPAAGELRARGDRALREGVPEVLPPLVDAVFPGDSVCLIQRLDVDFAVAAAALDDDDLARLWSREIVRALAAAITRGDDVLRFSGRAALVAQYVSDLAAGRAADRWYYAQFAPLAALPAASAIREAIVRESAIAFDVLGELARMARLRAVIAALSDRGAGQVLEAAFPRAGGAPSPPLVASLLAAWEECAADGAVAARIALRLAASVIEAATVHVDAAELRAHIDALLAFAAMLAGAAEPWSLVEAIVDGDAAAAVVRAASRERVTDLATLRFFTALAAARPDLVTCAASTLRLADFPSPAALGAELVPSAHAALALLLSPLVDLGILASDRAAPLRTLLAAKCAGVAGDALLDPIVRLFAGDDRNAGEPPDPLAAARHELLVTLAAHAVMTSFAARLPGFARSSAAHLRANFLTGPGAIRDDGRRIDIYLPPLPLALVLRIAGVDGKTFALPWLPGRAVTLHLPESS